MDFIHKRSWVLNRHYCGYFLGLPLPLFTTGSVFSEADEVDTVILGLPLLFFLTGSLSTEFTLDAILGLPLPLFTLGSGNGKDCSICNDLPDAAPLLVGVAGEHGGGGVNSIEFDSNMADCGIFFC